MFNNYPYKKEEIYKEYLQEISGIKFTFREIDVIACILHNRGNKKIASLLSVDYRTVEAHIRNIMGKIGCSSRDSIIDTIEKSGRLQQVRGYYNYLTIELLFNSKLKKIAVLANQNRVTCTINYRGTNDKDKKLLQQLKQILSSANISIEENSDDKYIKYYLCIFSETSTEYSKKVQDNTIFLLLDKTTNISIFKNLDYVDLSNNSDYHFNILKLVDKIINNPETTKIIEEFKTEYQALQDSCEGGSNLITTKSIQKKFLSLKSLLLLLILAVTILYYFHYSPTANQEQNTVKTETWNIPIYLEHYTDRAQITKAIWDRLHSGDAERKTAILVGLHGLGGVGKTTLAKNAIYNSQQEYSFKGWFSSETKNLLKNDYFQLGEKHYLFAEGMSEQQKIIRVKDWLEAQEKIFIVYDNVPDIEMLEEYLPNKGHIIITSRNYKIPGAIEVDIMTEQESIKLLENLLPQELKKNENYWNELKQLSEELGYLPLALSQAAAYIAENKLTIPEYLSLYNIEKNKLLSSKIMPPMDGHEAVYVTWDVSLEMIKKHLEGKNALELLNFIACCYPESIPKKLLTQHLFNNIDNKSMVQLNKTLSLLKNYSLIKNNTNTISIHRLVHDWLKSKHSKKQKFDVIKNAIIVTKAVFPWESKAAGDIAFMKLLLPHVEYIYSQANILFKKEEYISLTTILGNIYYTLGNYHKSMQIFKDAFNTKEKIFGFNNIRTARTSCDLSKAYLYLGNYAKAKELLEQALIVYKGYYGVKHIKITQIMHYLSWVYSIIGDDLQAKKILEEALLIYEKHYKFENIEIAPVLHQLGKVHSNLGNYREAEQVIEKTLLIYEKNYGSEHIETAFTYRSLGWCYLCSGNYKKSEQTLKKSLLFYEKYYGSEHIETAHNIHSLGLSYLYLGNYLKASQALENSMLIKERYYGINNVETAHIIHSLGLYYLYLTNFTKAQQLLEKAISIYENHYSINGMFLTNALESLGLCYIGLGNYNKGKELLREVLNTTTKLYGNNSIFTAKAIANLGNAERILKNNEESQKLLKQSHAILEKFYDYNEITIAKVIGNLGLLHGNLKNYKIKKEYLEKALSIFKKHLPSEHSDIKNTIKELDKVNNIKVNSFQENNINLGYHMILLP